MTFNDLVPVHTSGIVAVLFILSIVAYTWLTLAEYESRRGKSDQN